jgi:hypothetical protein
MDPERMLSNMKTTATTHKTKVRPEPVVPNADNPRFLKLYCAALTGLLSQPFTEYHPDHGQIPMDGKGELAQIKRCAIQAWNAAVYAMQEFDMDTFNSKVDHEA